MNLAATCEALGFPPANLIGTLANSFVPFIEGGRQRRDCLRIDHTLE